MAAVASMRGYEAAAVASGGAAAAPYWGGGASDPDAADLRPDLSAVLAAELSGSDDDTYSSGLGDEAHTTLSLVGEGLVAVPPDLPACFPALRQLCLHGNSIASVAGLAGLAALQELNLSSNSIAALPDGAFAGLPALTSLSLAGNCLADLGPGALAGLTRLRRLSLAHNSLASLVGLAALHGGPLERLDVRDNALASLAEFSVLAGLPRLAELQLAGGSPGEGMVGSGVACGVQGTARCSRSHKHGAAADIYHGPVCLQEKIIIADMKGAHPLAPACRQPCVPAAAVPPCHRRCAAPPAAAGWAASETWGSATIPGGPAAAGLSAAGSTCSPAAAAALPGAAPRAARPADGTATGRAAAGWRQLRAARGCASGAHSTGACIVCRHSGGQ